MSQRIARWLSLFSEYNFVVHYKLGKTNILADALSHIAAVEVAATISLRASISVAYESDAACSEIKYLRDLSDTARHRLSARSRAEVDRYGLDGDLLTYCVDRADPPRIVDDDLRA
ncbi:hypothetical protein PC115_g22120 [Phytophthora cactorum]|uniref:Reverse transcriptase RNase H-like domain-containing protein n=1 Tax=Phytophthora cactorum TaxID=29920 RepID=A0A8T1AL53_9STRA|nr:hypothetical protein PC115_g22120 [Phytophthora cactorum]KAG3125349.1 hypothetical protein C6341_g25816 [Phytophthora cactorum]